MNDINIQLILKALEENPNAKIKIEITQENRTDQWSKLNDVRHKWFKEIRNGHWDFGGKLSEVLGRENYCRKTEVAWNSIRCLALYMCGEESVATMKNPVKVANTIDELAEMLYTRALEAKNDNP